MKEIGDREEVSGKLGYFGERFGNVYSIEFMKGYVILREEYA